MRDGGTAVPPRGISLAARFDPGRAKSHRTPRVSDAVLRGRGFGTDSPKGRQPRQPSGWSFRRTGTHGQRDVGFRAARARVRSRSKPANDSDGRGGTCRSPVAYGWPRECFRSILTALPPRIPAVGGAAPGRIVAIERVGDSIQRDPPKSSIAAPEAPRPGRAISGSGGGCKVQTPDGPRERAFCPEFPEWTAGSCRGWSLAFIPDPANHRGEEFHHGREGTAQWSGDDRPPQKFGFAASPGRSARIRVEITQATPNAGIGPIRRSPKKRFPLRP